MTNAHGDLKEGSFTREIHERDGQFENLLVEAMRFSGALRGYLLVPSGEAFVIHTRFLTEGGETIATYPHSSQLAPEEVALLDRITKDHAGSSAALPAGWTSVAGGRTGEDRRPTLCLRIGNCENVPNLLYMEAAPGDAGFPIDVVRALELYAQALAAVLHLGVSSHERDTRLLQSPDRIRPDGRTELDGIDPAIIAGVAESIAIEVNDALSAVVAHASAGLQWLSHGTPKIEKARHSFRKIASSTFSIGGVLQGYRKPSRASSPGEQTSDLQAIVLEALDTLAQDLGEASVQTHCNIPPGILVHANANQIQQAIINVISVAVDAMRAVDTSRKLTVSGSAQDRYFVLALSDTGEAIPVDARDAIFDPLYTVKHGNRGIKLAIARTIAQLHGGSLDIARSKTDGATMLLKIPTAAEQ
jgi:signal transduction histidine kinase